MEQLNSQYKKLKTCEQAKEEDIFLSSTTLDKWSCLSPDQNSELSNKCDKYQWVTVKKTLPRHHPFDFPFSVHRYDGLVVYCWCSLSYVCIHYGTLSMSWYDRFKTFNTRKNSLCIHEYMHGSDWIENMFHSIGISRKTENIDPVGRKVKEYWRHYYLRNFILIIA